MNTANPHRWYDLTAHRPWEDWLSFVVGLAALVAPIALSATLSTTAVTAIAVLCISIMVLAMLELVDAGRWEDTLEALCGIGLMLSPWYFGYGATLATVHMAAGAVVLVLALLQFWQDGRRTA
jgi:hypothetical protein